MIGSRFAVRLAHYDGLGANEVVDRLRLLEREAGRPSDLGWVSAAMLEPRFTLVTVARGQKLRGYAAAVRRGSALQLQRLITLPGVDLDDAQISATLIRAVLRVAGHPPCRIVRAAPGSEALPMLARLGWQVIDDGPLGDPAAGPALRESPTQRW